MIDNVPGCSCPARLLGMITDSNAIFRFALSLTVVRWSSLYRVPIFRQLSRTVGDNVDRTASCFSAAYRSRFRLLVLFDLFAIRIDLRRIDSNGFRSFN